MSIKKFIKKTSEIAEDLIHGRPSETTLHQYNLTIEEICDKFRIFGKIGKAYVSGNRLFITISKGDTTINNFIPKPKKLNHQFHKCAQKNCFKSIEIKYQYCYKHKR